MVTNQVNWESFLDELDLCQKEVTYKGGYYKVDERIHNLVRGYRREWDDGVFLGNGMVGTMIYKEAPQTTMWEIGRNDVVAHNFLEGIDWAFPRVPIGNILLEVNGEIVSEEMRMHLWNAEASGKITTKTGEVTYTSYIPRTNDGIYIRVEVTGEEDINLSVQPVHGISDRIYFSAKPVHRSLLPPKPYISHKKDTMYSVQEFINDASGEVKREGACVLAWQTKQTDNVYEIYVSVQNEMERNEAIDKAVDDAIYFCDHKEQVLAAHRDWWHTYYQRSFVDMNDSMWKQFYWIQIYKLACSIRENGVVLDSQGPFMTDTPWPTTVWNLNVELSYSPLCTANRMELLESLIRVLKANKENLTENARPLGIEDGMYIPRATSPGMLLCPWPDTRELGNIFWALYTVDMRHKMVGDEDLIKELVFPYLKMAINTCRALIEKDENGVLHLMDTSSPEYPSVKGHNNYPIKDCNYTLALLYWGLDRILELNEEFGFNDELVGTWVDLRENLAPYPTDENGYRVGADIPFAVTHRHPAHLMMVYPLKTIDFNNAEEVELATRSINHWMGMEGGLQGFSFTLSSSMMACLKDGDKALELLNGLGAFTSSNTMYSEKGPVIETPISSAEAVHTMLLHSFGKAIEVFPAVPSAWTETSFDKLLAEGGFRVSAKREAGKTTYIKVESTLGKVLRIVLSDEVVNTLSASHEVVKVDEMRNIYEVVLAKGEIFEMK